MTRTLQWLFLVSVLLFVSGTTMFWIFGLLMCLFVGPAQSASRSFLARLVQPGSDGQMFGLYATTGRAVDRLRYIVRRQVEVLQAELPYVTLLLRLRGNTVTERWALDRRRAFDAVVGDLVREAVEAGQMRADVDPAVAARLLSGTVNSIAEWCRPDRSDG